VPGNEPEAVFGVTNALRVASRAGAPVYLVQEDLEHYWIKAIRKDRTEVLGRGAQAEGWFALVNRRGGVMLSLRDLAANFPKELEADGQRLTLHAWPQHARPVVYTNELPADGAASAPAADDGLAPIRRGYRVADLGQMWSCHSGQELDFELPAYFTQHHPKEGDISSATQTSAAGVSRTQEFLLYFSKPDTSVETFRQAHALFQDMPHALSAPAWIAASGALGPYAPLNVERFPQVEKGIYENFGKSLAAEATHAQWGMWNFGCVHERGEPWATHRIWNNHHYDLRAASGLSICAPAIPSSTAMRTGNTWHSLDVDMCHFDRPDQSPVPRQRGGLSYYDFLFHWGGTYHVWAFDTDLRYLRRARTWKGTCGPPTCATNGPTWRCAPRPPREAARGAAPCGRSTTRTSPHGIRASWTCCTGRSRSSSAGPCTSTTSVRPGLLAAVRCRFHAPPRP